MGTVCRNGSRAVVATAWQLDGLMSGLPLQRFAHLVFSSHAETRQEAVGEKRDFLRKNYLRLSKPAPLLSFIQTKRLWSMCGDLSKPFIESCHNKVPPVLTLIDDQKRNEFKE